MERILSTVLAIYLVTAFLRTADVRADSPFHSYDCYKDLCVDRLQFCDDREERCKMCTLGHCLPGARTPEQCKPHCPELLKPSTTQSTTSSETLITRLATTLSLTVPQVNAQTDEGNNLTITLSTNEVVLACGVLALILLVLLVIVAATLHVAKDTRRQFQQYTRHAFGRKEALPNAEEGEALLPWGSSSSSGGGVKTAGGHSGNSSTASTPVKADPAPEILNPSSPPSPASSTDTLGGAGPSYTARPATGPQDSQTSRAFPDTGSTSSLHHHKGCDYRLMRQQPEDGHCHRGPPPYEDYGPQTRRQHQGAAQTQSAFCDARDVARHHGAAANDHGTFVKSI